MLIEKFQLNLLRHLSRSLLAVTVIVLLHGIRVKHVVSDVVASKEGLHNDVLLISLLVARYEELALLQPEARFQVVSYQHLVVLRYPQEVLAEYVMVPLADGQVYGKRIILQLLLWRSLTDADFRQDELAEVAFRMNLHPGISRFTSELSQEIILQVRHQFYCNTWSFHG